MKLKDLKLGQSFVFSKLSPKAKKNHQDALKHAKDTLGKAKIRLSDAQKKNNQDAIKEEKETVKFWQDRIISITDKLKEA